MTDRSRGVKNTRNRAKMLISKIIPFKEWKTRRNPTKKEIEMYYKIYNSLKELSVIKNNDFQTRKFHRIDACKSKFKWSRRCKTSGL